MKIQYTKSCKVMILVISHYAITNSHITKSKIPFSFFINIAHSQSTSDFSKKQERDLSYMIKGNEAYRNIMKDNEKIEFLNQFRINTSKTARIAKRGKSMA